jgi:RHS repeat-associated protein
MHAAHRSRLVSAIACCLIASVVAFLPSALADSASSDAYVQLVQGDSPLAYWRLNGGASASTTDATGNGHTLQWVDPLGMSRAPTLGALALPTLQPDTAVQFDGLDSAPYGKVPNDGLLNPETFSVEAWVKPIGDLPIVNDGTIREAIISSYSGCEPPGDSIGCELRGYQLYISNYLNWGAHPQFAFSTGNDTATGESNKNWVVDRQTIVNTNTWYHVVATATPRLNGYAEMHLYVNGENVANCPEDGAGTCPRSGTFDPKNSDKPTFLGLGTREGVKTYRLDGEMDEVAVYDHVLTADQVLAHYQAGTAEQPTLSLSYSTDRSAYEGGRMGLSLSVGNVSDVTEANLTAKVTGANTRSIPVTLNGTTAAFSYQSSKTGVDTIRVSGTINGYSVQSNAVKVFWVAGAGSTEGSFGDSSGNIYAYVPTCFWGDPVNSVTGNFFETYTDFSLPGDGVPFKLDRTYNSRDESVGPLGKGWSADMLTSLVIDEAGNVTVKAGGGEEVGYILQADGSLKADANVTAELTKTSSGYDLLLRDQNVQHFDSNGHLLSWLDANGQGLHFAYDGAGRLAGVTDSGGREIGFAYDAAGHLSQVTLPDSSTIAYGYDGDLLTSFTDQTGAVTRYVYGDTGLLARAVDASGKVLFENTYDDSGRVLTQTDPAGNTISFDWSRGEASDPSGTWKDSYTDRNELTKRTDALGNTTSYSYNAMSEPVSTTDPLGHETTMTYDERGNMLSQTDALGHTEYWTYDQDNNVLSHTDQLGNVTHYTYDANGNVLTETDPLGATTSYEYDSAGRQVSETDPLGRVSRSVYNSDGNLIETISPSGARTTYAYDALGRQVSETDPLGHTTTSEYDAAGRLIKTTDSLGHSTSSIYDAAGRLATQTDAKGNETRYEYDAAGRQVAVIAPNGATTRSTYDQFGYLVASTDALGNVTRYEYDALGRQTATISPTGARTTTTYDANGKVVASTDPLGHATATDYDVLGRVLETTDPLGRKNRTVYDAAGNVVKTIDPLGNATTSVYDAAGRVTKKIDSLGNFTTSSYDAAGQVVTETDANGNTIHHTYDVDGREVSITSPSGAITTSTYDAAGNLISSSDANGRVTTHAYNAAGNQTSEVNALGARTTYSYDANGNQVSSTDPLGHTSTTAYDSMNRRIASTDPLGRTARTAYDLNGKVIRKTDALGNVTRSEYDAEGRLVKQTDPLGNETTSSYDDAGELISKTDPNGHTTHYDYDAAGQKTSVTAPGGSVTSYDYNANGNVVKRTDANGHATSYSYDAAGNKVSKTNALGRSWTYSYDPGGNLIQTKTPSGGTITDSYDAENRLVKKSYSDATPAVSYTYDLVGNKLSMVDAAGTTRYAYDAAGERTSSISPSGGFLYTYDLDGNLLSRSYPNALETTYSYNDASEMATASVKGKTTRYSHDANGNLVSTLHPSGILDERSYDAAGRLTKIKGKDSHGRFFYVRSYTYDAAGNPLTQKAIGPRSHSHGWWGKVWLHKGHHALARWIETYSYDSLNRLTKACMNESCSHYYSYSYDPVGNRTKLETKKSTTSYTYDAADELTSASKLRHRKTELTNYAYDLNGNETQEGSTHYSYNLENKLTQVVDKHEKVSYSYTGEGLMNTRSTRSETTSYSWDTSSELPELALETTSKGQGRHVDTDTTGYTYGAGPIGTETQRGSYTFHTDALGSVVALSDDHGKLVEAYRYTPYGESYGPGFSGEAESDSLSSMRFAGQYLDSESDLYYMRAREYEPETGRFLQVDPIEAGAGNAYLGTYIYADDQPTLKTDPSGMCVPSGDSTMSPCMNLNPPTGTAKSPVLPWIRLSAYFSALGDVGKTEKQSTCFWRINPSTRKKEYLHNDPGFTNWYYGHPACAPWCAIAVSKWFGTSGSKAFAKHFRFEGVWNMSHAATTGDGFDWVKNGAPQLGDIVVYAHSAGVAEPGDHTGIVWSASSRYSFLTIEGNTSSGGVGGTGTGSGVDGVYIRQRNIPEPYPGFKTAKFIRIIR